MSFENMFPNASKALQNVRGNYKAAKILIETSDNISGVNGAIDSLWTTIESVHTAAAEDWENIQRHYGKKTDIVEGLKDWADWLGLQRTHSYLPTAKMTFENLKKEFSKIDKDKKMIRKLYKSPEDYQNKVLVPLCKNAKETFKKYEKHKDTEMEKYSKSHSDMTFEENNIYAFWALLKMIHTSTHDETARVGKHYIQAFGGGFLGLLFAKVNDLVFTQVYGREKGPSNKIENNFDLSRFHRDDYTSD